MNLITSSIFKSARMQLKMEQKEFAKILGVNQSTISRIESRLQSPRPDLLRKLSKYTGKTLQQMVDEALEDFR